MSKRRVVVTGLGMLSPLGLDVASSWQGIIAGKSGVSKVERFDVSKYSSQISAMVKGFDELVTEYFDKKEIRRFDEFVQFSVAATDQALRDARFEITDENADRVGMTIGSGIGGLPSIERNFVALDSGGPRKMSPFFIPGAIVNMAPGYTAIKFGARGPNYSLVSACATGNHNIGEAFRVIAYGDADVMVTGGAEMATCPLGLGGFGAMRALSTRNDEPEKASRPWDKDRDGFVLGEGAGILVLEEYEHAKKRGAPIYAEIVGYGVSCDAYHISAGDPDAKGSVRAMQNALNDAGMNSTDIDYINAHGTSTPLGDEVEALAIKKAFGDHAYKIPVSSTKSMTGHLLGAAGGVEAIFSILAMRDQVAPPTINLDNPGDGCDLNFVPHEAQAHKLDVVMSNSFGFGGTNATVIFRKV